MELASLNLYICSCSICALTHIYHIINEKRVFYWNTKEFLLNAKSSVWWAGNIIQYSTLCSLSLFCLLCSRASVSNLRFSWIKSTHTRCILNERASLQLIKLQKMITKSKCRFHGSDPIFTTFVHIWTIQWDTKFNLVSESSAKMFSDAINRELLGE